MPARMIDFVYTCPACKHQSGQAAPRPGRTEATNGWLKCPECQCQFQVQLTLDTKNRQADGRPMLRQATLNYKPSKKYLDKIQAQKERDLKIKQQLGGAGVKT